MGSRRTRRTGLIDCVSSSLVEIFGLASRANAGIGGVFMIPLSVEPTSSKKQWRRKIQQTA